MTQQILFNSEDQFRQSFDNFYSGENQHVLSALKSGLRSSDQFNCFYLYGDSGCGKTHLLHSCVEQVNHSQYLDLSTQLTTLDDKFDVCGLDLLAIDNAELMINHQAQMLMIFEALKQRAKVLIFASTLSPKALSLSLKDLTSRLMSGQVFELKILNDDEKARALKLRAKRRGIDLSEEVISYIIHRYPRDFKTLFGLLDKFDDASLQSQRKITIPFIKQLAQ